MSSLGGRPASACFAFAGSVNRADPSPRLGRCLRLPRSVERPPNVQKVAVGVGTLERHEHGWPEVAPCPDNDRRGP